ncbi:MAG: DUF6427 family protein [Flavobacteriales bacterium]
MLAGPFRSNRPAILLAVIPLLVVLFAPQLQRSLLSGQVMPLYGLLRALLVDATWWVGALYMLLLGGLAVQVTGLANEADLVERRNHLPALLLVLLMASFDRTGMVDPALVGMPFVLWALRRTWSLSNRGRVLAPLFDAGVLLGIAGLFYLPYLFLLVVVWASVSVIRPFDGREYVLPLLGVAVVVYLCWGTLHLLDEPSWRPFLTVSDRGRSLPAIEPPQGQRWLLHVLLVPLILVALYRFLDGYQRGVMRVKNLRSAYLAFGAAVAVVIAGAWVLNQGFPPVLIAVPLSVVLAYAFMGSVWTWLADAAMIGLFLIALWVQWA